MKKCFYMMYTRRLLMDIFNLSSGELDAHLANKDPLCCLHTGIKLYHVRGGLWCALGYIADGYDVHRYSVIAKVRRDYIRGQA